MKQILIAIVCLFMGAGAASAQTVDTKVCDILAQLADFWVVISFGECLGG
ncbi:MAG: hypothetical protein QOI94_99 [Acidobacteriaceae bacterium]|jgi:hypothetical protein|nr:hypothetical protein [Acidobacteriaceae bacterium]